MYNNVAPCVSRPVRIEEAAKEAAWDDVNHYRENYTADRDKNDN